MKVSELIKILESVENKDLDIMLSAGFGIQDIICVGHAWTKQPDDLRFLLIEGLSTERSKVFKNIDYTLVISDKRLYMKF